MSPVRFCQTNPRPQQRQTAQALPPSPCLLAITIPWARQPPTETLVHAVVVGLLRRQGPVLCGARQPLDHKGKGQILPLALNFMATEVQLEQLCLHVCPAQLLWG